MSSPVTPQSFTNGHGNISRSASIESVQRAMELLRINEDQEDQVMGTTVLLLLPDCIRIPCISFCELDVSNVFKFISKYLFNN